MRSKTDPKSARERAVDLLARRALSEHELRARLVVRGHPEPEVAAALARMRELDYLDDARLAAAVAASAARDGRGARWVAMALRRRGLPETLDGGDDGDGDDSNSGDGNGDGNGDGDGGLTEVALAAAARQLQRRFGPMPPADAPTYGRAYRFLCRRGFSHARGHTLLRGEPPAAGS